MRFLFSASLLFLLLIFTCNSFPQKRTNLSGSKELLGKWEAVNLNPTTTITYEYKPGNKFQYLLTSGLNGKYKLIGNRLISIYEIPSLKNVQTDTSVIMVRLDTLYQATVQGEKQVVNKLVRLNGKARLGTGIIGEWINTSSPRRNLVIFKPNGKLELRNVLRDISGKYSITGDNITVVARGESIMQNRFAFSNGYLLLYTKGVAAPIKLKRVRR